MQLSYLQNLSVYSTTYVQGNWRFFRTVGPNSFILPHLRTANSVQKENSVLSEIYHSKFCSKRKRKKEKQQQILFKKRKKGKKNHSKFTSHRRHPLNLLLLSHSHHCWFDLKILLRAHMFYRFCVSCSELEEWSWVCSRSYIRWSRDPGGRNSLCCCATRSGWNDCAGVGVLRAPLS